MPIRCRWPPSLRGAYGAQVTRSGRQPAPHDTRAASSNPDALAARVLAESAGWLRPAVPDYELQTMLGAGGYGAVHLAKHRASGRLVALKVLLPRVAVNPRLRTRFRREIDVHARLVHPHVVALDEYGEAAGAFWFTMEYCAGGSLANHVAAAGGRLGLAEAAPLMLDALAGLAAAHRCGYVHRDVKPHNILLAAGPGPGWVAKISDFGLAGSVLQTGLFGMTRADVLRAEAPSEQSAEAPLTTADGHGGSWPYMPREQFIDFRDVRPATDVWSVAATFYAVLAGTPPREVDPGQDPVAAVLDSRPAPIRTRVPELPEPVAAVIDRALDVDVASRYQDASELRAALLAAMRSAP